MQILQAKIQCLPRLEHTGWFPLNQGLTILTGDNSVQTRDLLLGLESINPLYLCQSRKPLEKHLRFLERNGYTKRINPQRKTAAYSIYSAPTELVKELVHLNPALYETDRIEIGRRLDYSSWISFVEMSQATRFKEFEKETAPVLNTLSNIERKEYSEIVQRYKTNDRISGEFADKLGQWWNKAFIPSSQKETDYKKEIRRLIARADHFKQAKAVVNSWLPPYIYLDETPKLQQEYSLSKNHSSYGPITTLLSGITQLQEIQCKMDQLCQHAKKLFPAVPVPEYTFTQDTFAIRPNSCSFPVIDYLITLYLLCRLSYTSAPFFLLHHVDKPIQPARLQQFSTQLETIGANCQLLFVPLKPENYIRHKQNSLQLLNREQEGIILPYSRT